MTEQVSSENGQVQNKTIQDPLMLIAFENTMSSRLSLLLLLLPLTVRTSSSSSTSSTRLAWNLHPHLNHHRYRRLDAAPTMSSSSNMSAKASSSRDDDDKWADSAELYSNQADRLTELHGADLVAILKDDILKAKTILDVGCGTGAFAKAYLKQFPKGVPGQTLISSDLSEGMLQKARETVVPGPECQTEVVFQVEDGTKLEDIQDASVDIVVSLFGVFLIPDYQLALSAIARVLRNGGIFANGSWMFGQSDYFTSQGFGVSMQDAFQVPNDIINPSESIKASYLDWTTPNDVKSLLAAHVSSSGDIKTYSALHNTVWEFDPAWTMFLKNPMLKLNEGDENVAKAKKAFADFVTQQSTLSLEDPIMFTTASILAVARGFGSKLSF